MNQSLEKLSHITVQNFGQLQKDGGWNALRPSFKFTKLFWLNANCGGYLDARTPRLLTDIVKFPTNK